MDDLSKAPESLLPSMKAALDEVERLIADSMSGGGVELSTLRQLRTNLRRKTDGMTQQGGGDAVSYLKTVYKSLTNDMNEAVVNYGGEDAVKALSKADTYTKNRQKFDVEPVYDQLHRDKKMKCKRLRFDARHKGRWRKIKENIAKYSCRRKRRHTSINIKQAGYDKSRWTRCH